MINKICRMLRIVFFKNGFPNEIFYNTAYELVCIKVFLRKVKIGAMMKIDSKNSTAKSKNIFYSATTLHPLKTSVFTTKNSVFKFKTKKSTRCAWEAENAD